MICGECPNCEAFMMNEYGGPGHVTQGTCEECGKPFWLVHSMLDPVAYTESGFREEYEVDEDAKTVRRRRA